jgi:hypothetical protein
MNPHTYQRQVIAYHGCDRGTFEVALLHGENLRPSERPWDWLGRGIYFWEHGPDRARQWADEKREKGEIQEAAVLGAIIQLGNCFDLLDTRYTGLLAQAWPQLLESLELTGQKLPENKSKAHADQDKLIRTLDCFVLNWTLERLEKATGIRFDSVRGIFEEGRPAFPGSSIHTKSHIQIAVREPACIVGFFSPPSHQP